ncbi:MAG: T9SS type A sorting domain-containing protein [Flavobacteriales bacterium]
MKTIVSVIFFLFIGITTKIYAQCSSSSITFQKTYGGSANERAHSIQPTSDGGYIVAGETTSFGAGGKDWFVMKIDMNGVEQWTKTYGSTSDDDGFSITIKQTSDLGFIVSGSTNGFGAGSFDDSYIIKLDNTGLIQWEKRITGSSYDRFRDVVELTNGDFLLTGSGLSFASGNMDAHLVRISSTGNLVWIKNIGTSGREHSQSIIELPGGNYLLSGNTNITNNSSTNRANPFLIKTSNDGSVIWGKQYNLTTFFTDFNETILLSDGNLLSVGETRSSDAGSHDIFLIKTDTNGAIIWSNKYGGTGNDIGVNVKENTNGELVISAFTDSYGNANQFLIITTDNNGNIIWSKTYGGSNNDELDWWGKPMVVTATSEIIMTGGTMSFGAGNEDIYVVKTNECGESFCNEQIVTLTTTSISPTSSNFTVLTTSGGSLVNTSSTVNSISFAENTLCDSNLVSVIEISDIDNDLIVYPNPTVNYLNVKINNGLEIQTIDIYNIAGQKVDTKYIQKTDDFIQIDVKDLKEGLYFLKINNKSKAVKTSKFFKMQ